MAINSQALLPQSTQKSANIGKDLVKVNRTVIKLNKFFKKSNVQKRKELQQDRRKKVKEKREREEERLENLKDENRDLKFKLSSYEPKIGFIGSIKRFIGNAILGFFAVKFLDQLPKLRSFLGFVSSATSFIADIGVGLVDGLASFIDFGYKAFEGTKKLLGDIDGNNVTELFDGIIDKVSTMIDVLIVASLVAGKNIFDTFGDGGPRGRGRRGGRGGGFGPFGGGPRKPGKGPDDKPDKPGKPVRPPFGGLSYAAAAAVGALIAIATRGRVKASPIQVQNAVRSINRAGVAGSIIKQAARRKTASQLTGDVVRGAITSSKRKQALNVRSEVGARSLVEATVGQMTEPRRSSRPPRQTSAPKVDPSRLTGDINISKPSRTPPARKTFSTVGVSDDLLKRQIISNPKAKKVFERFLIKKLKTRDPFGLYPSTLTLEDLSEVFETTPDRLINSELSVKGPKGFKNVLKLEGLVTQGLSAPPIPEKGISVRGPREFLPPGSGRRITGDVLQGPELPPKGPQRNLLSRLNNIKGFKTGLAIDILFAGVDLAIRLAEGQSIKQAAAGTIAGALGGLGGFVAGSKAGAAIGGGIGALFGGIGAVPGAAIGGILGGLIGGFAGGAGASALADKATGVEQRNEGGLIKGDLVRSTDREYQTGVSAKKVPSPSQIKLDINTDETYKEQVYQLDKIDFFGPIMALAGKILVGQTPDSSDYRNVGLGYAALIQRASIDGVLTGTPAFQGGGAVNLMSRVGQGIANWVAETVKGVIINPIKNISTLFDGKINEGRLPVYIPPFELPSAPPPLTAPPAISEEKDTGGTFTGTMNRDLAALVAISALESGSAQGRADVAQSIYNRLGDPGKAYGKSLFSIVTANGQYQPAYINPNVSSGPGTKTSAEFLNITDRSSAITAMMSYYRKRNKNVSRQQAAKDFDDTLAAISNKQRQESAAELVGGRTEFLGAGVPIHRLDQAEVRTRGGVFDNQFFEAYGTGGDDNLKIQQGPKFAPKGLFGDQSSTPTEKLISFRPKDLSGIQSYPSYDSMSSETIIINRNQIIDQQVAAAPQESAPIIIPIFRDDPFESLDFVG